VDIQVRFPSDRDARRIALLVTKETHAPEALLEAEAAGDLADDGEEAEIPVVVGNRGDLRSLAERYDKPFYDVGDGNGNTDEERLLDLLAEYDVDLIVLARYMRILSPEVVFRYEGRIINVHPSLLPAFPGAEAYRQAKVAGVRVAGVTAHYVTTDLDQGPVIAQRAFDVPPGADVAEIKRRGQPLEADVLLNAVRLHLADAIAIHRGTVHVREDTTVDAQLGLSEAAVDANPDEPVDGGSRCRSRGRRPPRATESVRFECVGGKRPPFKRSRDVSSSMQSHRAFRRFVADASAAVRSDERLVLLFYCSCLSPRSPCSSTTPCPSSTGSRRYFPWRCRGRGVLRRQISLQTEF